MFVLLDKRKTHIKYNIIQLQMELNTKKKKQNNTNINKE